MVTTYERAKAASRHTDRIIQLAKRGNPFTMEKLREYTHTDKIADKVYHILAPRYKERTGSYTRVIKLHNRFRK